jgi:hypothetical protein
VPIPSLDERLQKACAPGAPGGATVEGVANGEFFMV